MTRCVLLSVLAVSMGLASGCGAPPGADAAATNGLSEALGDDGVLRRTSIGRDGYEHELAFFRQRLRELEASPDAGKEKLAAGMAEIVARLEGLTVEPGVTGLQSTGETCGANYKLVVNVYPSFAYGSSRAEASYVEFGPPSPWSKNLYTYAYASSGPYTGDEHHYGTFSGAGTFSVPTSNAATGPDFCQHLIAWSYINPNGCVNGFRSAYAEWVCP